MMSGKMPYRHQGPARRTASSFEFDPKRATSSLLLSPMSAAAVVEMIIGHQLRDAGVPVLVDDREISLNEVAAVLSKSRPLVVRPISAAGHGRRRLCSLSVSRPHSAGPVRI